MIVLLIFVFVLMVLYIYTLAFSKTERNKKARNVMFVKSFYAKMKRNRRFSNTVAAIGSVPL